MVKLYHTWLRNMAPWSMWHWIWWKLMQHYCFIKILKHSLRAFKARQYFQNWKWYMKLGRNCACWSLNTIMVEMPKSGGTCHEMLHVSPAPWIENFRIWNILVLPINRNDLRINWCLIFKGSPAYKETCEILHHKDDMFGICKRAHWASVSIKPNDVNKAHWSFLDIWDIHN